MYFIKKLEKWKIFKWEDIKKHIEWLADWIYSIEIKKYWTRSEAQNKYYWWVVLNIISKETWNNPQELHYFFKHKFIDSLSWMPSSRELDKWEFVDYIEKIKDFVSQSMWILIPDSI